MEALIQTSKSAIKVRVPNIYRFLFIFCIGMMLNETVLVSAVDPPHATIASVKVPDREIVNQPIFIDVAVINDSGDAKAGGISLSLPDNPLASIIHADTTKATVSSTGLVTAVANGTATITATSGSATATASVTVAQVATGVSLSESTLTFASLAATTQLTATVTDANGETIPSPSITWTTSNDAVATVSSTGLVTSVAEGSARFHLPCRG